MKPTKTPWEITPDANGFIWANGRGIAQVYRRADLQLMAAAPELLAALKDAADVIQDLDGGNPETNSGWASEEACAAWMKIRAAIAKAEGRP